MVEAKVKEFIELLQSQSKEGHLRLESLSLHGLKLLEARKGYILCNFIVSNRIVDENGNWEAGALATLIDDVGASAVYSFVGHNIVSLDFSISYFSPVKINEEVEIEANVNGEKGKLTSVLIEVRKKETKELIALGKQWMASTSIANSNKSSKL